MVSPTFEVAYKEWEGESTPYNSIGAQASGAGVAFPVAFPF